MASRFSGVLSTLMRHRRIRLLDKLSKFIGGLPASDKVLVVILGLVFSGTCIIGLVALEHTVLVEVPAYGGSLREGTVGSPRFVNPLLALTDADRDLVSLTYAGLMGISPEGLHPVLAESYTISADGKVYTFVLRKGLKFTDGSPITSEDIVFTVTKAQDPTLKSPELANWANIRAEAVDAQTIRFTLPKAYAPFLENTTLGILPARLWKNMPNEQFPFSPLMSDPVGAGPFEVTSVIRDKQKSISEYRLRAFSGYALGKPYLSTMRILFFTSADELAQAYKNGKIESAYGIPNKGALTSPYARIFGVFLNPERNKALARIEVRRALSIAVDRTHITADILGGYAVPLMGPVPPGGSVVGPSIPSGDRVTLAKRTLTDAGWVYDEKSGAWKNVKSKLTLEPIAIATSNVPELKTLAASIENDWQAIGVTASLELYDANVLSTEVIRPRKYDALFFGMVVGRNQDLFAFWDSSQRQDPGLNIALYNNRAVDQLLEKARQESDEKARKAELQKISDMISGEYAAVFTHAPSFVYALPKDLSGVTLPQITSPSDRFATVSSWHRHTEWVWPIFVKQ